jgi:hypothetical protein
LKYYPISSFFILISKKNQREMHEKKKNQRKKILILHIFRKLKGFKIVLAFFHLQG